MERIVNVVNDSVTRLDLSPVAAWTTALPNPVTVTLSKGSIVNLPLTISNSGPLQASFTIQPAASALTSGSSLAGSFSYHEEPSNDPADTHSETAGDKTAGSNPAAQEGGILMGGEPRLFGVATPFPGTAGYRYATASCNGETFYVIGGQTASTSVAEVWMYNPTNNSWTAKAPLPSPTANMRAACVDGKIYVVGGYNTGTWNNNFQIYDTLTNSWTLTTQPVTGAPMVVAYNGLLYSLGGASPAGAINQAGVYNPVTATWSTLTSLPTAASYSGALVYKNLIFLIGGSNTADVQVYNPASNTWDNSGPDLPGPRMDPVVGWYGDQIYLLNGGGNGSYWIPYPEGYILNASTWPAGSWTMVGPTVLRPKAAPASICAGNRLWSVGGVVTTDEEHITQFYDAGLMCNRTYPSVPWLTVTPQSGVVLAGNTSAITLGLNANVALYNNPGVYHAILKFNSDAPSVMPDIPVTMVVVQTSAALTVTPGSATKPVLATYVSYDFTVTNTSGASDSFSVGSLGITSGWTAIINPPSFTNLANGGSAMLHVRLFPPAGSAVGDEGVVTLYVQVHDNPSQYASISAIAKIVQTYQVQIPYIKK